MLYRVLDFETTGFPSEGKPSGLLQIGWTDLHYDDREKVVVSVGEPVNFYVNPFRGNPSLEIDIGAMATHHITKEDVANSPSPDVVMRDLVKGADAFACHNKMHDGQYFAPQAPFVCTLKAAQRVWPGMESHSNQYLRYALNLPVRRDLAEPAHHAGPDSYVTAHLLAAILAEGATLSDLIEWGHSATLLKNIKFGKHKGMAFEEIPTDYLQYLRNNPTGKPDRDLIATIEFHLDKRGAL